MMLAGPTLAGDPGHHPHSAARRARRCSPSSAIVTKGRAAIRGLQRQFGIDSPRIAVAGLNPHAGEDGTLGREEIEIIMPAIERLREEGYDVSGPHPPDIMFHERRRRNYDAALCMYHDQALIPLKTLHFDEGINMHAGPADRAHLARSRHRLRHRRQGHRRSRRDDRRHPHRRGMRARGSPRREQLAGLPPLREVIARHGLSASKALGPEFPARRAIARPDRARARAARGRARL